MKVKEIVDLIETAAPRELAYEWDNSGFLCGNINKEAKRVYITLDVNMHTVDEAVKRGADMIIAHHPIMFRGIKQIDRATPEGYVIYKLISNDMALYCAHTSMDCAKGGINDVLADKLGIYETKIIEENKAFPGCGLGRIGKTKPTTLKEFAKKVKLALNTPFVRICGAEDTVIKTAAVGAGACDELIPAARDMGADVMVTADMKYHTAADSVESGICIIDAGHYPTEAFVTEIFADILKDCELDIVISDEKDVFKTV